MNPLETGKLDQALDTLKLKLAKAEQDSSHASFAHTRHERSGTKSPPLLTGDANTQQAVDAQKLTQAGGRLAVPLEHLRRRSKMEKEHLDRVMMWLDPPRESEAGYNDVLPLATKQLEHWTTFQQYWQWGNRGKTARLKGFGVFLAAMQKDYLDKGEAEFVADQSFADMAQRKWENEQPLYTASPSNTETFTSYRRALKDRLKAHGFNNTRPIKLLVDPRREDAWTTWVEYLNYIYWELDEDTTSMEKARPRFRKAMEELLRERARPSSSNMLDTKQDRYNKAWADLNRVCDRFNKIRKDSETYLKYERLVRRDQLRAEWVLKEITLIEKARAAVTNGKRPRKRKTRHDEEVEDEEEEEEEEGKGEEEEENIKAETAPSPLKRSRTRASAASSGG